MSTSTVIPNRRIWLAGLALVAALAWLAATRWPMEPAANPAAMVATPDVVAQLKIGPAQSHLADAGTTTATPQPMSMVDITRIVPRRASEAQRDDYRRRLDIDPDLVLFAAELKQNAELGDSDAAAALASLHAFCAEALRVPVTPRKYGQSAPDPRAQPASIPAQRCARFGTPGELTALNLRSTASAWRHTAAQLGDLPSQLIGDGSFYARPGSPQALQRQRAAEEMLRRGEYVVLRENLHLVASLADGGLSPALGSAICMLAGPCKTKECRYRCEERVEAEWQQLAPREQRVRLGQQAAVLEAIRSGQFDTLWPKPLAGAPR
jgi:hypothetical protein